MIQTQPSAYQFTPVSVGPDWLTATAPASSEWRAFRHAGNSLIDNERAAAREVKAAALRDYRGWRGDGWFVGERPEDTIIVLSGPACPPNFDSVAPYARNLSRLDLQVTVWTHGETPPLVEESLQLLDTAPRRRGRPRSYGMHLRRPHGETLEVGSRASDAYARLYDYSTAHKKGPPRTLFRYEVELKRRLAARTGRAYARASDRETFAAGFVHSWFQARGIEPTWSKSESLHSGVLEVERVSRDVLDWLERTVSVTIRRQVKAHGLSAVISALGLAHLVQPIPQGGDDHAAQPAGPVSPHSEGRD